MAVALRWTWVGLAVLALAGAGWMTRYEHIRFESGRGGFAEWRWDRWRHRACFTYWDTKTGKQSTLCSK